jgi:hypothetical protein
MRSIMICIFKKYYDNQIKEDETGKACSTHGRDKEFWSEKLTRKDHM